MRNLVGYDLLDCVLGGEGKPLRELSRVLGDYYLPNIHDNLIGFNPSLHALDYRVFFGFISRFAKN